MKFNKSMIAAFLMFGLITGCAKKSNDDDPMPAPKIYQFGTPAAFSVTAKENGALISFTDNPAAAGGYHIYFGDSEELDGFTNSQGQDSVASPVTTQANSIILGNLDNGTTYYFAVAALKADGTESARTGTLSVVPVDLPGNQVQKTIEAELEFCVDQLDKIKFSEGKMILSYHEPTSDWPGQNNDCDIDGIRLHTREEHNGSFINRIIPASSNWSPGSVGSDFNLAIYNIVTTSPMTITELSSTEDSCASISFTGNKVRVTAESDNTGIPNTISFDASECPNNKAYNFIGEDAISFKLTYVITED